MKMIFDLDLDKCTACGACAIACMDQNDIWPDRGDQPFRRIGTLEHNYNKDFTYLSIACMHCDDAPCISSCPTGCLKKDSNNLTIYDSQLCIGCHSCAMACPYGAPSYGSSGKISKCVGCSVRVEYGLEPACVRVCPSKALIFIPEEEYEKVKPKNSLRMKMTQK